MTESGKTIVDFLHGNPDLQMIRDTLRRDGQVGVYGLGDGQRTLVGAALVQDRYKENLLVICDSQKRAKSLWEDMGQLMPKYEVLYFPALELIPFEILGQSRELEQQRLSVLARLLQGDGQRPVAVITTIEGFGKSLMPAEAVGRAIKPLRVGDRVDPEGLRQYLVQHGYEGTGQVQGPGEFAFRGGIVDVFSVNYDYPMRIEFFDDEVDSIRFFKVEDQRSISKTQEVALFPAREFFIADEVRQSGMEKIKAAFTQQLEQLGKKHVREPVERLQGRVGEIMEKLRQNILCAGLEQYQCYFYPQGASILEYMGNTLVWVDEVNRCQDAQEHLQRERLHGFTELLMKGGALPEQNSFFISTDQMMAELGQYQRLCFSLMPKSALFSQGAKLLTLDCKSIPPFFGKPQLLADELNNWQRQRFAVVILLTSAAKALRLQQLLEDHGLESSWIADRYQMDYGQIYLAYGNLGQGAQFTRSKLVLLTENEVFQQQKKRVNKKMFHEDGQRITHLDELKVGDYVVHVNHGIGRYMGIQRLTVGEVDRDYLIIKYSGEDKLYVPIDQFDLLQKYTADEEAAPPKVNKLGGTEWQKTKAKVKASVEQMAHQLLEIYARRQSQPGYAFGPDDQWQKEFEDAFPYVETEDQLKAINDVKNDMMQPRVMDRLICGDVGYGKTEVAIRAAFKCINDGKQVAMLVPTTVLAQQHYNTFSQRFEPYGAKVELLSRFRSAKEQKEVIKGLADGSVDVVIGTHKLLNKSVQYKDLGLLVIDEEQRFGVTHKEKIKALRSQVDVLTMSATPIPRTLHMSLVGIRDMSIIETPPQDRYPIQTYIVEQSPELVKDAIRRELGRGGQVFFVHNRVEDIAHVAEEVSLLVPEARIAVGHGKMKEHELEEIMLDFINHEYDVLVCTTIIETGLDIANANTLIIDEADKMGLSQLYQLRGRVGRSNRVAYAYLTYKPDRTLTQLAEKRLSAVREYTELGSGFKIAMRDLEIRGAGNLLGSEQHGQVSAVGFDLYCKLLDDAIKRLKGEAQQAELQVEMDLQINAFIPDYYIKDSATKLGFYQRIQRTRSAGRLDMLMEELEDRFGDLPRETVNLFKAAGLKIMCYDLRIRSIKQKAGIVTFSFSPDVQFELPALFAVAKQFQRRLNYTNAGGELVLKLTVGSMAGEECLDLVKDVLLALTAIVPEK